MIHLRMKFEAVSPFGQFFRVERVEGIASGSEG